ncbi:MAG TPA: ATP-binding protein [Ilumatobacter sp.]|nr:ATP-binding protein [Ilumatobacter sp.]
MPRLRDLLRPLVADIHLDADGWASQTLTTSLRRTVLVAVAGWQAVMLFAVVGSLGVAPWLVAGHGAMIVYAIAALRYPLPAWLLPIGQGALAVGAFQASGDIDSVVTLAACWQINFAGCAAGLLVLHRSVVPAVVGGSIVVAGLTAGLLPDWGLDLPVSIVVTQTSIIAALRIGLPSLLHLAQRAELEEASAAEAALRTEIVHRVSKQVAEESRTLHDTAINTLAAISVGGAAISDHGEVQRQCARDVAVLRTLRGERARDTSPRLAEALFEPRGLPVQRSGLDDAALRRIEAEMDPVRVRAVIGCVREAVTNALKHAGVEQVGITATTTGECLVVVVEDAGRGFDPQVASGRGVTNSIIARAADAGVAARVESAPGRGTRVEVAAPIRGPERPAPELTSAFVDPDQIASALHRRAGLLWATGATAVSTVLAAAGSTNHHLALFPMIAVMALATTTSYLTRARRLTGWGAGAVTAATVIVFVLSAAATAFGTRGAAHWHALAATAPFVLLLSHRPPLRWVAAAAAVWAAAIAAVAVHAGTSSLNSAGVVVVAGLVGLGFTAALWQFQALVSSLGAQAATAQRRALAATIAADAEVETQATYRRWLDAGLDDAIDLLGSVATGVRSLTDPETRRLCDDEESYLRQLVLISPELVHLGSAMMSTLGEARSRRLHFRLRLGARDTADAHTALRIGGEVMRALAAVPAGSVVSASVFPVERGLQLTISGTGAQGGRDLGETDAEHPDWPDRSGDRPGLIQMHFAVPTVSHQTTIGRYQPFGNGIGRARSAFDGMAANAEREP